MAPRLSRWILMTSVAAAVVAVLFLTTGGTPLLFVGYGEIAWPGAPEGTQLSRRINGVQSALARVSAKRDYLETRSLVAEALRHTTADPVVFRRVGNTLTIDQPHTAELRPLWASLPARRPDMRTVILLEPERPETYFLGRPIDAAGACVVRQFGRDSWNSWNDLTDQVRTIWGECLFAESFGRPGAGAMGWMRGLPTIQWGRSGRDGRLRSLMYDDVGARAPAWFESGPRDMWGNGWRHMPIGRAEMACLVGRAGLCEQAAGVGASGWPPAGRGWSPIPQLLPVQGLPSDLLVALGPDRFSRIWRSPDPIATSYARVTGLPMEVWLRQWALRFVPEPRRDNGLSLLGWIGALLWLVLLGILTRERLRQRSVT